MRWGERVPSPSPVLGDGGSLRTMLLPATSAGPLLSSVGPAVTQVGVCGGLIRDGLHPSA